MSFDSIQSKETEIITAINPNQLGVSLAYNNFRIRIYEKTMEAINVPEFFCFLLNEQDKRLALCPCSMNDAGSYRNRGLLDGREYVLNSSGLIKYLYQMMNWDKKYSYLLKGEYNVEKRLVEFDLKKAAVIKIGL
ncbi:MAG: hypothetical protein J6M65_05510 [Eubacterium sp.]|nr:hypothetical protein [Eubacterium sp.]